MSLGRLLLRNLLFHWRGNSAVFLGVVVGAAVLTGALLVGDSLRGSLRDLTLQRLGWVDEAMITPRFFRQKLAMELVQAKAADRIAPAIVLQATARRKDEVRGVRGVTVLGVDDSFWLGFNESRQPEKGMWLSNAVATALNAKEGDEVSLVLQKPSAIPRESLLGRRDDKNLTQLWTLPVERVLSDADAADHFSLRPGLDATLTVFVPLFLLQKELKLIESEKIPLVGVQEITVLTNARINAILVGRGAPQIAAELRERVNLKDWGLVLEKPGDRVFDLFAKLDPKHSGELRFSQWNGLIASSTVEAINPKEKNILKRDDVSSYYARQGSYLALTSRQLLIEPAVVEAAKEAAKENNLTCEPSLVYLANTIAFVKDPKESIPYSVVAAVEPSFLPAQFAKLGDNEIVLADWKQSPFKVKADDQVTVSYFPPEHQGEPKERSATFTVAGFVPLEGATGDPYITAEFPGITDKRGFNEWEDLPFPYDPKRTTQRDRDYWSRYRTTPKAYINLETGQRLWGTRFGRVTSIRLIPKGKDVNLSMVAKAFSKSLLENLPPEKGGFVFDKVKLHALEASSGGTDFAGLFLGFSCFLIVAALLLVGLLYRLNLDRRASEIGLLLATGYRRWQVLRLLLLEGLILSGLGAFVGCGAAVLYSILLIRFLGAIWPGGTLQSFLRPHYTLQSLGIGFVASLLVSVATIFWAMRVLGKIAPSALLAGRTTAEREPGSPLGPRWSKWIAPIALVLGIGTLAASPWMKAGEERAGSFFSAGGLLLIACLAGIAWWMASSRHRTVEGHGWLSVGRLGVRNAARHPARSLLTAGLLAAAAFLLVAVEAFRRQGDDSGNGLHSASGGFLLLAESDQPIVRDLNTDDARREIGDKLQVIYRNKLGGDNQKAEKQADDALDLLKKVKFYSFRVHAGDDASCLNLYQPRKPRILGVPTSLIERGGFEFAASTTSNPWDALKRDDSPYPAFGEKNTVEWMLHSGAGGEYKVPDEDGKLQSLRFDGLLQDSVFQSGLLVSERNFLDVLYPRQEGYNFFLIDVDAKDADQVKEILETALADRGFEVTRTADRLASFLAVENTYLSTFQALGGLGLILGSLGLAVVLLRGVWERRAELALLRALGFRRGMLGWLVLAENAFLLVLGLTAGTLSALAAVAPQLVSANASVPWRNLLVLLAVVLLVGLAAGAAAVARTLRAPLIPALRRE